MVSLLRTILECRVKQCILYVGSYCLCVRWDLNGVCVRRDYIVFEQDKFIQSALYKRGFAYSSVGDGTFLQPVCGTGFEDFYIASV